MNSKLLSTCLFLNFPSRFICLLEVVTLNFVKILLVIVLMTMQTLSALNVDEMDTEEVSDLLQSFYNNPLDLNAASVAEIIEIPYINLLTAEHIIARRIKRGDFKSVKQLLQKKLLTLDVYEVTSKCFFIATMKKRGDKLKMESRYKYNLQKSRAYLDTIYRGDRNYLKSKLTYTNGNYLLALIMKKDPGEVYYYDTYKYSVAYNSPMFCVALGSFNYKSVSGLNIVESSFNDLKKS